MPKQNLTKSIDAMIDDLFAEKVTKSEDLNIGKEASTTADAVTNQAPKAESDASRGAGRPKQISEIPETDEDGKRAGEYDGDISNDQTAEDQPEASQVKMAGQDKGRQEPDSMPMAKSVDKAEYAEFLEYKRNKAAKREEKQLRKAFEEQKDLIKSAIKEATSSIVKENAELKKSLSDTQQLVKAMADRPQRRKSVDGIQALEKSQSQEQQAATFSKSEMLDVAEELVMKKSMDFRDDHLIELENTGYIYDSNARKILENALKNKK